MLLQHILRQLDAELDRLLALRKIIVGLAGTPAAVKNLPPKLDNLFKVSPKGRGMPRGQGKPRKKNAIAPPVPRISKVSLPTELSGAMRSEATEAMASQLAHNNENADIVIRPIRYSKPLLPLEPTAFARFMHSGPVVVSAAALVQERERRAAIKSKIRNEAEQLPASEMAPESLSRDLAARWFIGTNAPHN